MKVVCGALREVRPTLEKRVLEELLGMGETPLFIE